MSEGLAPAVAAASEPRRREALVGEALRLAQLGSLVASLAIGLLLLLRARPLSADEATGLVSVDDDFGGTVAWALEHDPGQAAHRAALHLAATVGDGEGWLRLPSLVAVVAAVALVAWLGRMVAGRLAGAAAGAAVALSAGVAESGQLMQPYALALAAVALSSALFARAMTAGGTGWWIAYAAVAAFLPLVHPAAGAAIAAHAAALAVGRRTVSCRLALPALGVVAIVAGLFATAAVIDRRDAVGDGDLSLWAFGAGLARATGWNVVALGLAVWGLAALAASRPRGPDTWRVVLVAGLVLAPPAAVLTAGAALPVFPRLALVASAPGLAVATGAGLAAIASRRLRLACAGVAVAVSVAVLSVVAVRSPAEDWSGAARFVQVQRASSETVVVWPRRAQAALAYYAPYLHLSQRALGSGAWAVIRASPRDAVEIGRASVATPRYALLDQRTFGARLVVQHWVRP